jgi:hypothetical protein
LTATVDNLGAVDNLALLIFARRILSVVVDTLDSGGAGGRFSSGCG